MAETHLKVFRVGADYIKKRPKPYYYYVVAETKVQARAKFKSIVSWLDIISIDECTEEAAQHVISHPMNYIIW